MQLSVRTAALIAAATLMSTVAAACGGSGKDEASEAASAKTAAPTPTQAAKPKGDARPRVEGRWRVVYTPRDEAKADEDRANWRTVSRCEAGACSFRISSNHGLRTTASFDTAIGDYAITTTNSIDCTNNDSGELVYRAAYKERGRLTLTLSESVIAADGVDYATEMFGTRTIRSTRKKAARGLCDAANEPEFEEVRAVRIDKPIGKPGKAAADAPLGD